MWDGLNLNSLSEAAAGLTATVDSVFDNALNLDNLQKEGSEGTKVETDAGSLAPLRNRNPLIHLRLKLTL